MTFKFVGALGFGLPASCDTVMTFPLTRIAPERAVVTVFGCTVNVPEPLPEPEPLTVIQLTVVPIVQLQPAEVVTVMVPVAPRSGAVMLDGVTV